MTTDDFAKGEDIHAVRFSGDTAYVITFEYTDPLFVIDLSNPKKPIIKGSVKISGFSTNLIPIDSDTLLGIGTANNISNPYAQGIKFALFDVSDPQKPTVLDSKTIKNTASEAQDTHKAILVNKSENYFAIPFEYHATLKSPCEKSLRRLAEVTKGLGEAASVYSPMRSRMG